MRYRARTGATARLRTGEGLGAPAAGCARALGEPLSRATPSARAASRSAVTLLAREAGRQYRPRARQPPRGGVRVANAPLTRARSAQHELRRGTKRGRIAGYEQRRDD